MNFGESKVSLILILQGLLKIFLPDYFNTIKSIYVLTYKVWDSWTVNIDQELHQKA